MARGLVALHRQMRGPRETVEPGCVVIIQLMDSEPPASVVPLCPLESALCVDPPLSRLVVQVFAPS